MPLIDPHDTDYAAFNPRAVCGPRPNLRLLAPEKEANFLTLQHTSRGGMKRNLPLTNRYFPRCKLQEQPGIEMSTFTAPFYTIASRSAINCEFPVIKKWR